jgi:2'-5' RNA ligase
MSHRLFIALQPPVEVREALIDTMEALDGARWQDGQQLHLTLRFIGEVERPVAEDLDAALAGIAWPSFIVALEGVSHFERKGGLAWPRTTLSQVRATREPGTTHVQQHQKTRLAISAILRQTDEIRRKSEVMHPAPTSSLVISASPRGPNGR